MANAEHLEILKSGVAKWNKWREENEDIKPDLSDAKLRDAKLRDADLSDADLISADLSSANFFSANLSGADLTKASLSDADLISANLTDAKLLGTSLISAYLTLADLTDANLTDANLTNANLPRANLTNANLTRANLTGADLTNAYLVGTNLTGADLIRVNLYSAYLTRADLTRARIGDAVFGLTNLSTCKGLETMEVIRPCTIDFQTLRASKKIPKSFLLKIGLPELYIDYLPDFYQNEGIQFYPVFLSHSWENKDFARKLYEALIAKGVNVFFDEKRMKPGDNIFDSLSRGIELYDKTILVCSKDSLNSWWVDHELELVTEKERNLQKEIGEKVGLLIPITIDEHIYTWPGGKRMAIKNRVIGDFSKWQEEAEFEKALSDLIHALDVDRPDIKPPTYIKKK